MLAFSFTLGAPQSHATDRWFAVDKWKHFASSAVIQAVGYGVASSRNGHSASLRIGAAVSVAAGIGKEVRDRRRGGLFSVRDLVWDAAGTGAAGAALHGTR
jgi:uncharacterized protein YfiM (DUF2279 family)